MRRMLWIWFVTASSAAWAHEEHDECLHHHWLAPEYRTEIRYQLVGIGVIALVFGVLALISHIRRSRRCAS